VIVDVRLAPVLLIHVPCSVILRAVQAARDAGARHVFIVADEEDWPRHLYARLGFDQIGRTWEFLRPPLATQRPPSDPS
jgi:hypothetical protein